MAVVSKHWCDNLHMIRLSLRNAFREDFRCSPAELVYGQIRRLPSEYFKSSTRDTDLTDFTKNQRSTLVKVKHVDPNHYIKSTIFVNHRLSYYTHVFVRIDAVKKPLVHPYERPFKVVSSQEVHGRRGPQKLNGLPSIASRQHILKVLTMICNLKLVEELQSKIGRRTSRTSSKISGVNEGGYVVVHYKH